MCDENMADDVTGQQRGRIVPHQGSVNGGRRQSRAVCLSFARLVFFLAPCRQSPATQRPVCQAIREKLASADSLQGE